MTRVTVARNNFDIARLVASSNNFSNQSAFGAWGSGLLSGLTARISQITPKEEGKLKELAEKISKDRKVTNKELGELLTRYAKLATNDEFSINLERPVQFFTVTRLGGKPG
jgi:hypothetical protein